MECRRLHATEEEQIPLLPRIVSPPRGVSAVFRVWLAIGTMLAVAAVSSLILPNRVSPAVFLHLNIKEEEPSEKKKDAFCWFRLEPTHVPRHQPAYPSFWNYYSNDKNASLDECVTQLQPIHVDYDARALRIEQERVLLLGGSLHPSRLTKQTFASALTEAVHQGLNLVTMYFIWSAQQPFANVPMDFTLPSLHNATSSSSWDWQQAVRMAANHGLFVHLRIGPYVCAEYSYGGIPEWLPLRSEMSLRRPNAAWMTAMQDYVTQVITYFQEHQLFAYQGGPILLAQIENEIGDAELNDVDDPDLLLVDNDTGRFVSSMEESTDASSISVRNATMQDYADWCGALVQQLAPQVVWTMCSGLSAPSTISTYNGFLESDKDIHDWMDMNGDTHRIQVDQPALWTEDEGGFQIWGESPEHPTDYVWGKTARSMAFAALRWFARGGSHLNFYMWLGGYNRGRAAAAAITNAYAMDAPLCPSGQRHYPKFLHLQALLLALRRVAPILLQSPSALHQEVFLRVRTSRGKWASHPQVRMFSYPSPSSIVTSAGQDIVDFVENSSNVSYLVQICNETAVQYLEMPPYSAVLRWNGQILFDSSNVSIESKSFVRRMDDSNGIEISDWVYWREPIGVLVAEKSFMNDSTRVSSAIKHDVSSLIRTDMFPMEQTALNIAAQVSSDYAWYETDFIWPLPRVPLEDDDNDTMVHLILEAPDANAFTVYLDGHWVGAVESHDRLEQRQRLTLDLAASRYLQPNVRHRLAILSESLGYSNLIGRWGHGTHAKVKGLVGDFLIASSSRPFNLSLTDGTHVWRMFPGLHGAQCANATTEHRRFDHVTRQRLDENLPRLVSVPNLDDTSPSTGGGMWTSFLFHIAEYDPTVKGLFLDLSGFGRGHFWLNGQDMGRYWNITRAGGDGNATSGSAVDNVSQRYYFLPYDYLYVSSSSSSSSSESHTFADSSSLWNELILFDSLVGGSGYQPSTRLVWSWIDACTRNETCAMEDEVDFPVACI